MPGHAVPDARELSRLWNGVVGSLQFELTPHQFETWLKETTPLALEHGILTIEARTDFACNWIEQHLAASISAMVAERVGQPTEVRFRPRVVSTNEGPLELGVAASPAPLLVGHVNCAYTFETYVVGDNNRGAFAAASGVVAEATWTMGPVFLWGPPGMGKTHLLHAAACQAVAAGWPVTCLPANQLVDRYMDAIRAERVGDFHRQLRGARLLVIDDLQYLAGRRGVLEELLHAVDAVTNAGGRVMIGSEQHPLDLGLPERLGGRFASGAVARITPLARPERAALAQRAAERAGVPLPEWVIARVSAFEVSCVRRLQGCVNAAVLLQRTGRLDVATLDGELSRIAVAAARSGAISDVELIERLARHFMLDVAAVRGRDRHVAAATARAATASALHARGRSLAEVGALLDGRDKGTINGLLKRGKKVIDGDPGLAALLAG